MIRVLWGFIAVFLFCSFVHAEMYSCDYKDGTRTMTNMDCEEGGQRRIIEQDTGQSYVDAGGTRSYYQSARIVFVQAAAEPTQSEYAADGRSDAERARAKEAGATYQKSMSGLADSIGRMVQRR